MAQRVGGRFGASPFWSARASHDRRENQPTMKSHGIQISIAGGYTIIVSIINYNPMRPTI